MAISAQVFAGSQSAGKVLLSHPTGNQNVRGALDALDGAGMLAEFWTCLSDTSPFLRFMPGNLSGAFARRSFPQVKSAPIYTVPGRELCRLAALRLQWKWITQSFSSPFHDHSVARAFDARVAKRIAARPPDAVYAYDVGAVQAFRAAKREGTRRIYELQTAHWTFVQETFDAEARLRPEFASTIRVSIAKEKQARLDEELALADLILVPSRFVARSLASAGVSAPIEVVPYGAPVVSSRPRTKHSSAMP